MPPLFREISRQISFALAVLFLLCALPASAQDLYLTSRNTNAVKRYNAATGAYISDFVAANSGGLNAPQEVLFLPDGDLIVTARFNTAIKRYDGTTGAFLGDFTSGYSLSQPTKTTLGPDSLLYVSQWGSAQNKVVRFTLAGDFVDEFTDVGVPQGCGHAWDSSGNFYVARWGGGNAGEVLRFDTAGNSLGTFVPTGQISGPVNVFFGAGNRFFVLDWQLGELSRYDATSGQFIDKPLTQMGNPEGWVFDSTGFLYITDWTGDRAFKIDTSSWTAVTLITGGGLDAPNSLTFGPSGPVGLAMEEVNAGVAVRSGPERLYFDVELDVSGEMVLEVLDTHGKVCAEVHRGLVQQGKTVLEWDTSTLSDGVYFYRMTSGNRFFSGKILVVK